MREFNFYLPTQIVFGEKRIRELGERIVDFSDSVLLVTDKNVAQKTELADQVLKLLKNRKTVLFDEVEENPSLATLEKVKKIARDARVKTVIGLGGGSPMDAAKGAALLCVNDKKMNEYLGGAEVQNPPLPVICLPTTSGTGSEATPFAVFTDPKDQSKKGFSHPGLFPKLSILDPELTYSMPEEVVINTGLDALTHAIEAYLSMETFELNDLLAFKSIEIIINNLEGAAQKNHDAMGKMAYAAMLAGAAIAHASTILLHIMGYPLTVFHHLPHGKANAVLLPAFLDFMGRSSFIKEKVEGVQSFFKPFGGVVRYVNSLGVSTRLKDHGVMQEQLPEFVEKVIVKGDVKITPAEVTRDTIQEIYESALD